MFASLRKVARRILPLRARRALSLWGLRGTRWPSPGLVRFGSFRRLTPISADWGFDRGLPIDRYYIERFLHAQEGRIRGRVLEIDSNAYTVRFGGDRVLRSDVLNIAEMKPGVTLVGDLSNGDHLPSEAFDCIILTQTLQFIYDVRAALRTVHRMLKPGGCALVTIPGLSKMSGDPDGSWGYFWGFTSLSARRLFEECLPGAEIEMTVHGNVLSSLGFLYGLAAEELDQAELDHVDPELELLITIRATKAGDSA